MSMAGGSMSANWSRHTGGQPRRLPAECRSVRHASVSAVLNELGQLGQGYGQAQHSGARFHPALGA